MLFFIKKCTHLAFKLQVPVRKLLTETKDVASDVVECMGSLRQMFNSKIIWIWIHLHVYDLHGRNVPFHHPRLNIIPSKSQVVPHPRKKLIQFPQHLLGYLWNISKKLNTTQTYSIGRCIVASDRSVFDAHRVGEQLRWKSCHVLHKLLTEKRIL